ncbi:MAG: HsdM family class I SAM-dependent methyltransferase, partial [Candidatus Hodarchaeales archaeon]
MTTKMPLTTEQVFKSIVNSIPTNFNEKMSKRELDQLKQFSEITDIPLESTEVFRELTALLILNRLRFISLYGTGILDSNTIYATFQTVSDLLKQGYPQVFTASILDSIANLSSLIVSSSLLNSNDVFQSQSTEDISALYLTILNQKYRRKLGQFWTPIHIAEFMLDLMLENNPRNILDPCTGPGTFIHTLERISNYSGTITAIELHPLLYEIAQVCLYSSPKKTEIINADFLTSPITDFNNVLYDISSFRSGNGLDSFLETKNHGFEGIVCNPPYSRHHVLSSIIKKEIGDEIEEAFGKKFSRISSLFMYFILKSLKMLLKNGRMVFITPTIIFESRNSDYLKKILKNRYRIPFIIVFHHSLNIFAGVDTAACICIIDGKKPEPQDVTKLLILKKWSSKEKIRNY